MFCCTKLSLYVIFKFFFFLFSLFIYLKIKLFIFLWRVAASLLTQEFIVYPVYCMVGMNIPPPPYLKMVWRKWKWWVGFMNGACTIICPLRLAIWYLCHSRRIVLLGNMIVILGHQGLKIGKMLHHPRNCPYTYLSSSLLIEVDCG